jgi:hypothetical protein
VVGLGSFRIGSRWRGLDWIANMASGKAVLAIIKAARPQFRSAHDRVAFAVHASLLAEGYSLTAVGSAATSDSPPAGWFSLCFNSVCLFGFYHIGALRTSFISASR